MTVAVGVDIAKEIHWACLKVAETGKLLTSHKVDNTAPDIADLIDEISAAAAEHGPVTVGINILGGIAALIEAMLLDAGSPWCMFLVWRSTAPGAALSAVNTNPTPRTPR